MISTRDLSDLPDIDALKRLMQSMAMLDAILHPEWEFRRYSFNAKWSKGKQMGSMRNGHGDDLFALFSNEGCFVKGFWHESKMTPYARRTHKVWPGVLDSVPNVFSSALHEPAFAMDDTTFCTWRQYKDNCWQCGKITFPTFIPRYEGHPEDPDGSEWLLSPYDGKPETFLEYAPTTTLARVQHVYSQKPLTEKLVKAINPELTLADLKLDIEEIGYPQHTAES